MKGTIFQKPFEFNLELPGETWNQGQSLNGSLVVTSHGAETLDLENHGIALALGKVKKVKSKDSDAFNIFETLAFSKNSVAAGDKVNLDFSFPLPLNGPISDKTQSFYLIYGNLEKQEGHLQLTVEPSLAFKPLLDVLDIFFRFKFKERKYAKDSIEFKLIAPDSKDFKGLETLILKMKEIPESGLEFTATFNLKNVGITDGNVAVQKTKETRKVKLIFNDYLFQKDSPNQDAIRKIFQDLFDDVITKQYF